ncbi:MAG: hypothetical protein ACHQT8_05410 [Chlamydiales bacterium]
MRVLIFFLCFCISLSATTLKEKLARGAAGDYIVSKQEKNLSLLRIKEITPTSLLLEEISAPLSLLNPATCIWQKWIEEGAPGHSAWVIYEIDLRSGKLVTCYSPALGTWVSVDEPVLPKMLNLSLTPTPEDRRKRIGPPPRAGEEDHRSLWTPPLVFDGKKLARPFCEALETTWPKDGTDLSQCRLVFYFLPDFPFPCWIEASNGHFTFKIHTLASGRIKAEG